MYLLQMLGDVGIRCNLQAPDYSAFTQMVQDGECPFFYTGRAGTESPSATLKTMP